MTRHQKHEYQEPDELRKFFNQLQGKKFSLDCGHHITFGFFLGNNIIIRNGKRLEFICMECGQ